MKKKRNQTRGFKILISAVIGFSCLGLIMSQKTETKANAAEEAGNRTLAPYFFIPDADPLLDQFPLEGTRIEVQVAGVIARVQITQVWKNSGKRAIEAVYVFPGSTRAAVHDLEMRVGKRVIRADIAERARALQTYEQARDSGHTASLLEQERPNVFQMSVANILPGDRIEVMLTYSELLVPSEGEYELVVPAVVGPRYSNQPAAQAKERDRFVESAYTLPGIPPASSLDLEVKLSAGMPIQQVTCPTHQIKMERPGPDRAVVHLAERAGGNRDFILRYRLSENRISSGLLLFEGKDESFFLLLLEPPQRVRPEDIPPREYIFVLDVSGSMMGFPLDTAKELMKNLIGGLREKDTFNVVLFENNTAVWAPRSLSATQQNMKQAIRFIESQSGGGGTELANALRRALTLPAESGCARTIVVCTDGYISFETDVFQVVRDNLGRADLFAFGIGSSVNRFLIEGLARAGCGEPFVVTGPGTDAAERFRAYVSTPLLTDISVRFDGFPANEIIPAQVPNLFASRPLAIFGKWNPPAHGKIIISGRTAQGWWEERMDTSSGRSSSEHSALRELWARQRVAELGDDLGVDRTSSENIVEGLIKQITELGLRYRLLTAYTSFVAVDIVKRGKEKALQVQQPLPLPSGVPITAVGGGLAGGSGGMSFQLTEMWSQVGLVSRLVGLFFSITALYAFFTSIWLLFRGIRLRRQMRQLSQPMLAQLAVGKLEPAELSWPEIKTPGLLALAEAVRQELPGRGPLTVIASLNQALEILAAPLLRIVHRLRALGLGACLIGLLGTIFGILNSLQSVAMTGSNAGGTMAAGLAEAIIPLIFGLFVGIACLLVAGLSKGRVRTMRQSFSVRIMAAYMKTKT